MLRNLFGKETWRGELSLAIIYRCAGCGRVISESNECYCPATICPYCKRRLTRKPIYVFVRRKENKADRVILSNSLSPRVKLGDELYRTKRYERVVDGYVLFLERCDILQTEKEG